MYRKLLDFMRSLSLLGVGGCSLDSLVMLLILWLSQSDGFLWLSGMNSEVSLIGDFFIRL